MNRGTNDALELPVVHVDGCREWRRCGHVDLLLREKFADLERLTTFDRERNDPSSDRSKIVNGDPLDLPEHRANGRTQQNDAIPYGIDPDLLCVVDRCTETDDVVIGLLPCFEAMRS